MANPEHVGWILEGPEAWNKRQEDNQFTPDLSGVDLHEEFQKAGKLDNDGMIPIQGIDLQGANLEHLRARYANLEGAKLFRAYLKGAYLCDANMKGVNLTGANLQESDLDEANLENADLTGAQLQDAWLLRASLKEAKIRNANTERAHLEEAGLEGADLSHTQLDGASLKSARLPGARLRYATLRSACLDGTDLTEAYLFGSDLTQTSLIDANLVGANLGEAILKGTDLQGANLTNTILEGARFDNAYLTGTSPLKAILFRQTNFTPTQSEEGREPVNSIEDLLSEIRKLQKRHGTATLYFRGEAKCDWSLRPSVMRSSISMAESDMLIDLISRRPEDFNAANSALAQWVLAQHHGLKTRFLDITRNPLVALYSACQEAGEENSRLHIFAVPKTLIKPFTSDTIAIIANFAKLSQAQQDVILGKETCSCHSPAHSFTSFDYQTALRQLYQLVREEKPNFEERINPRDLYKVFVVEPQQSPERIRAQSGAFLASAFHERFERGSIQQWNDRIPVYAHYRLAIQGNNKREIMEDLRLMNITQETLFPGLDTAAKAVIDFHYQEDEQKKKDQLDWNMLASGPNSPTTETGTEEQNQTC